MNAILSRLWLWFWHLLPANPIVVRVVQGGSRRSRHLWLRVGYLAALLIVVLFSLVASMSSPTAALTELAKGASQTFKYASVTQLMLICFLAPVFTAAAITQERDAETFNILIATPLSNAQIVFGTLLSRLFFVLALLFAGLPIFLMTMVYGGVTAAQIIESFLISASTAVLTGSLAITVAMMRVGTRRTIFSFYLLIALYLFMVYILGRWNLTWVDVAPASIAGEKMSWLTPLHPFLALDVALSRVQAPSPALLADRSALARFSLAHPSQMYVLWTLVTSFVLTMLSAIFVRRGVKTGEPTFFSAIGNLFSRGQKAGEKTRPPRNVWNNPVAWREAQARAATGGAMRWAIVGAGVIASAYLLWGYASGDLSAAETREYLSFVVVVQFGITLLIAANAAAAAMSKEKDARTMDLLLTTLLTSRYILWGKLRGLVNFALPLILGPTAALLVFGIIGVFRKDHTVPPAIWLESAALLAVLMTVYVAIVSVIGLQISLNAKRSVTAVMYSVGTVLLLSGIATAIGMAICKSSGGQAGSMFAPFTPFTSVLFLINPADLFESTKDFARGASSARFLAFIGTAISTGIYTAIIFAIYKPLVRNFDMIMRKQSGQ
jgi:ABC-type transport system involved in multi-copper enzyme maturation permease subunit